MRRRCLLLALPVAWGCGPQEPPLTTTRVELPQGLAKPKGLRPDPKPSALTPAAPRIEESPGRPGPIDGTMAASAGKPDAPGVEGACRYDGGEVACWNLAGSQDRRLTGTVRSILQARGEALPTVVGRRNRLLVALLPRSTDAVVYSAIPQGANPFGGSLNSPALDGRARAFVFVAPDSHTPTASVRFLRQSRIAEEAPIRLAKGATATLAGVRLRVDSITKIDPADPTMAIFTHGRPTWKVVVVPVGRVPQGKRFFSVDAYPAATGDGRRAALRGNELVLAPKDALLTQNLDDSRLPPGGLAVLIDQDPAKAKTVRLGGDEERRTELTGVPLEPR